MMAAMHFETTGYIHPSKLIQRAGGLDDFFVLSGGGQRP